LKKITAILLLTASLFASWCVNCGKPLSKIHPTLKLENGQIREYCSKACKAEDIKKYGLKSDENLSTVDISAHKRYLTNLKKKKLYHMGKKIFQDRCKKVEDLDMYLDISDLEDDLKKNYCHDISDTRTWYVALYLWDKFHHSLIEENHNHIKVTKDEKCPVCGMFVYKYPRWAAQIWFKDKKHYSFDGVKDLTKYFRANKEQQKEIEKILVTDYYKQTAIDGLKAYYVIGSDVYGPMGEEAIPFEDEDDAKNFLKDHRGKKILKFKEVKF